MIRMTEVDSRPDRTGPDYLLPALPWLVKNQKHHIAGYHVISIMACDIKYITLLATM